MEPVPQSDFIEILETVTTLLSIVSIIALLGTIYIISKNFSNTISARIIRVILIYTLISQLITTGSKFQLFDSEVHIYLTASVLFLLGNGLAIIWSFALGMLSYKTITSKGRFDQFHFYKQFKIFASLYMFTFMALAIYLEIYPEEVKNLGRVIVLFFLPTQIILPIFSMILYLKQAIYVKKSYRQSLKYYNIKVNKLILYPLFEFLLFSPAVVDFIYAIFKWNINATVPYTIMTILQSVPGIFQYILFLWIRNVATSPFVQVPEDVSLETEFPEIYKDSQIDRNLSLALRD